jgi:hypothetical protein
MRGRPRCQLLRRFAPLLAVAALVGPPAAFAGTPSPDAPPSAPAGLAPDPAPGSHPSVSAPVQTTSAVAPVAPPPVHHVVPPARHSIAKHVQPKPKARPHRRAAAEPRFVVPRIALPASIGVPSARTLHTLDAVLAGLALLAAAAAAGSGARLVAVWNRRGAA